MDFIDFVVTVPKKGHSATLKLVEAAQRWRASLRDDGWGEDDLGRIIEALDALDADHAIVVVAKPR